MRFRQLSLCFRTFSAAIIILAHITIPPSPNGWSQYVEATMGPARTARLALAPRPRAMLEVYRCDASASPVRRVPRAAAEIISLDSPGQPRPAPPGSRAPALQLPTPLILRMAPLRTRRYRLRSDRALSVMRLTGDPTHNIPVWHRFERTRCSARVRPTW